MNTPESVGSIIQPPKDREAGAEAPVDTPSSRVNQCLMKVRGLIDMLEKVPVSSTNYDLAADLRSNLKEIAVESAQIASVHNTPDNAGISQVTGQAEDVKNAPINISVSEPAKNRLSEIEQAKAELNVIMKAHVGVAVEIVREHYLQPQNQGKLPTEIGTLLCDYASYMMIDKITRKHMDMVEFVCGFNSIVDSKESPFREDWSGHAMYLIKTKSGLFIAGSPANYKPDEDKNPFKTMHVAKSTEELLKKIREFEGGEWGNKEELDKFLSTTSSDEINGRIVSFVKSDRYEGGSGYSLPPVYKMVMEY